MDYSVVTTVFNDQNEILQFLDEMCSQDKLPKEIVIADGGGCDSTRNLIKEYGNLSVVPIKLFEGERLNIAEGFNKAIHEAKTDVVGIVAVGNHYPHHFFSTLCKTLEEKHNIEAVFSIMKGSKTTKFSEIYSKVFTKEQKLRCPTNHGTLIYKKSVEELGYFYENFFYAGEDEEFYGHFLENGKQAFCTDETWITWEVPKTQREYYRQCKVYLIGQMQMYSNIVLFRRFTKYGSCLLGTLAACISLFFEETRVWGTGILVFIFLFQCFLMSKKGMDIYFFYISTYLYQFFTLVRHGKYLLKRNKIDKNRRLYKAVKYTL